MVSRADDSTLVVTADQVLHATGPDLSVVDHHGAGEPMTAGIAVGLARGYPIERAPARGRRRDAATSPGTGGPGTGHRDQVERLAHEVVLVEPFAESSTEQSA